MGTPSYHVFLGHGSISTPGQSHPKNQRYISRVEKLNLRKGFTDSAIDMLECVEI